MFETIGAYEEYHSLIYLLFFIALYTFLAVAIYYKQNERLHTAFVLIFLFGFIVALFTDGFTILPIFFENITSLTAFPFQGWVHYGGPVDIENQQTFEQITLIDNNGNEYVLDPHAVHPHVHSVNPQHNVANEFENESQKADVFARYYLKNAEKHRNRILSNEYHMADRVNNELRRHQGLSWSKEYLENSSEFTKLRYSVVTYKYPDETESLDEIPADPDSPLITNRTIIYEYT